jgi:hypothetical protein
LEDFGVFVGTAQASFKGELSHQPRMIRQIFTPILMSFLLPEIADSMPIFKTTDTTTLFLIDTTIHPSTFRRLNVTFETMGLVADDTASVKTHASEVLNIIQRHLQKSFHVVSCAAFSNSGTGRLEDTLKCLDWLKQQQCSLRSTKAVLNLSITFPSHRGLDEKVLSMRRFSCWNGRRIDGWSGMDVVVAAGNMAQDACEYSPGRLGRHKIDGIHIIGAPNAFSNFGECITAIQGGSPFDARWEPGTSFSSARYSAQLLAQR